MTYPEKLHRSSCGVAILKQQRQVSTGAIDMNRNTPGTAYSRVFSLAHGSLKPLTGTKDSTAVQTIRTALLEMIRLMPPLQVTKVSIPHTSYPGRDDEQLPSST